MHLKDKAGSTREWDFPALGEGDVDFPKVFQKLEAAGNDCPFSVEIEFTQAGPESLAQINVAVETSAKYLIEHGFEL